jgi:hypothetical protein
MIQFQATFSARQGGRGPAPSRGVP